MPHPKIKTREELKAVIGPRPRKARVILAHGHFDIVHPGHLRHLRYAKTKADILIASVTSDRHIEKGAYRPHVPEALRAENLAELESVDYVLVDENATPLESIRALEPDFYAKGYEYQDAGSPKTAEETAALKVYGGEIIFTPGDIVYSSSRLIELARPSLKYEKLLSLMEMAEVSFDDLRNTLHHFDKYSVHVVGDTIIDSYTHTAMIGGQTKTPTLSVQYEREEKYVGGAAVVAKHLRAAGAEVQFSTVLGKDGLADFAWNDLRDCGITAKVIVDTTRPTTNKNAIVAEGYRLLKLDTLDNRSISDHIVSQLSEAIMATETGAVVFSDFRHGIFNRRTIPALTAAIQAPFRAADSQVASRWGNITEFKGFDLICPNEREARFALGDQDSGIRPLASALYTEARCKALLLKLGDRGLLGYAGLETFTVLDSFAKGIVDAVGAGDAMLAYATLAMLDTGYLAVSAILGSVAAGIECELDGNVPVTHTMVRERLNDIEKAANYG